MSIRNSQGFWIIPKEEVKEYMSGPVNFDELILNCLSPREQELLRKKFNDQRNGTVKQEVYYPKPTSPLANQFKSKKAPYTRKKVK